MVRSVGVQAKTIAVAAAKSANVASQYRRVSFCFSVQLQTI
jgi:hypothetical protein